MVTKIKCNTMPIYLIATEIYLVCKRQAEHWTSEMIFRAVKPCLLRGQPIHRTYRSVHWSDLLFVALATHLQTFTNIWFTQDHPHNPCIKAYHTVGAQCWAAADGPGANVLDSAQDSCRLVLVWKAFAYLDAAWNGPVICGSRYSG